jgi:hypothetical protein
VEEHWEELKKSKQEQVRKGDGLERGGTLSIGNKVRERGNTKRNWVKEREEVYELGKEQDKNRRKQD